MGQLLSCTPKDEDLGNLLSCFIDCFKTYKPENKIISEDIIQSVGSHLQTENIREISSVISEALQNIDNASINIAVTGMSGVGKSSLINALRGVGAEEKGAAETGVVETTMKRTPYKHPKIKTLTLWDLPGIGTQKFPLSDFLEKVKFQEYDFFLIVSASRFSQLDLDLAKEIERMGKNYYFVRTKVDVDLENEKKSKPSTFNRENILEQIRSYSVNTFSDYGMNAPQIFLISNHNLSDYDFPLLMDTLNKDLPVLKRHNFRLSLPNVTEAAIEKKHKSMQQFLCLKAMKDELLAGVSIGGIFRDSYVEKQKILNLCRYHFGVDDESLKLKAMYLQMSSEQLKSKLKSPSLEIKKEEENIEKEEKFFMKFWKFLKTILDILLTVVEDAKVILREMCSKT
ncbi:interferon-inducible GTPase 1-like [Meriones unguiculatus]|uniref:interferon-inducible GTPase 1-like n=1 Tax=Meriones unguiculatus TaxID=10047 RepID=UPI000B4EAD8E|nr:interferon-inducible GTPase 1-like [Meriones unguiculatus]XP_060233208.1 interferon-inducible GTPase 1-like [Meriones unguiculatus]XP_060233209.1 interferon-inducible GTPase 1-like [Meriones unguiculatus]XP_060233210.1 interferon-inducible GTPase 1-like [Meriones unguiculatus]XP_060233211.1 interferon-inducible GTPase 1-like [Meriones unguiculatus]XP_060233212.1 interferon-inducible GTPase 1-like [Meriones unguiculatus]